MSILFLCDECGARSRSPEGWRPYLEKMSIRHQCHRCHQLAEAKKPRTDPPLSDNQLTLEV